MNDGGQPTLLYADVVFFLFFLFFLFLNIQASGKRRPAKTLFWFPIPTLTLPLCLSASLRSCLLCLPRTPQAAL